ncbi:PqqD family protein [Metabacillus halosaccharovorans]|uniref:PqqD family peptide modification chaperone n=1 Tax=Metabacillus halosaccharovorans TaxID=930124 RepID=UPI00403DCC51
MNHTYIQKNNYDSTQLDEEWIILNTENFTVTKLNEIGGFCWTLLKEPQTIDSIIREIELNYRVLDLNIQQHINVFINDLLKCGLIEHASLSN